MSLLQRAATLAAVTLALAGFANSAPGLAAELDRPTVAALATATLSSPMLSTPAPHPGSPATASVQTVSATPAVLTIAAPTLDADEQVTAAEEEKFASLAEAVAAQDMAATDSEDLRCLAGAIYFESQGEPIQGQLAVAEVIINRSRSGRFPSDICGVVTQRGQFSFVRGGEVPSIDASRAAYRTALKVAKVALADAWDSPASNALYFNARRAAPGGRYTRIAAIGNHVFWR